MSMAVGPSDFTDRASARMIDGRPASRAWQVVPSILASMASIEASFALFVFSGRFKGLPGLRQSPVDLTLFFLVATFGLVGWGLTSGRLSPLRLTPPVVLMLLFCEVAAMSIFWSSLDSINLDKLARFLLLTGSGFFLACLLAQDPVRRKRLIGWVAWLSLGIVLYYLYYRYVLGIDTMTEYWIDRETDGGDNYLEYGENAAILLMILVTMATLGSWRHILVAAPGSGAACCVLLSVGSRGPLAFSILSVVILGLVLAIRSRSGFHRSGRRLAGFAACIVVLGLVGYVAANSGTDAEKEGFHTIERIRTQLSGEDTLSMDLRAGGRTLAFNQWLRKPLLGWGIGEFRVQDNFLRYPHNTLLEVLMEMGLVGACLYVAVLMDCILRCWRVARAPPTGWPDIAMIVLFLTTLCWEMTVEGYLADDRIFFTFIGMVVGSRVVQRPALIAK